MSSVNMGRGYFNNLTNEHLNLVREYVTAVKENNSTNQRPNWVRAYVAAVKRVGKNSANKQFPQIRNWVSTQRMLGKNNRVFYNSNSTRSRGSSKSKTHKTRKN